MAGEAKTNSFMLGTATVMLGPQAQLFDLTPAEHSIGLVKNFTMTSEPQYTELTQGVKNTLVMSVLTRNVVRATMEVYEFTGKNIAYGLGLDASSMETPNVETTVANEVVGDGNIKAIPVASATNLAEGDVILLWDDSNDGVLPRKIASIAMNTLTVDKAIPDGVTLEVGAKVQKVNRIDVGSLQEQPFLAAKVVGKLADGKSAVILIPKVRITKGFTLAFSTENFGNLPFEFSVYDLVATDPLYADFKDRGSAAVYANS